MSYWHQNDPRTLAEQGTYEQEARLRLNPYDPSRATSDTPDQLTTGQRMRWLWSRLLALFGRKPDDSAPEA